MTEGGASDSEQIDKSPAGGKETKRDKSSSEGCSLFVSNLSRNVKNGHLEDIFGVYGTINKAELEMSPVNRISKGNAVIEFAVAEEAEAALQHLDGGQLDGQVMKVSYVLVSQRRRRASPDRNKDDSDVIRKREKDGKKSTTRDLDRNIAKKFEERKKISPDKNNLSKPPHDKQTSERRPDSDRVRDSTRSDRGKERGSQQPPRDQGRQNSRDRGGTRRVRSRSPLQSERRRPSPPDSRVRRRSRSPLNQDVRDGRRNSLQPRRGGRMAYNPALSRTARERGGRVAGRDSDRVRGSGRFGSDINRDRGGRDGVRRSRSRTRSRSRSRGNGRGYRGRRRYSRSSSRHRSRSRSYRSYSSRSRSLSSYSRSRSRSPYSSSSRSGSRSSYSGSSGSYSSSSSSRSRSRSSSRGDRRRRR